MQGEHAKCHNIFAFRMINVSGFKTCSVFYPGSTEDIKTMSIRGFCVLALFAQLITAVSFRVEQEQYTRTSYIIICVCYEWVSWAQTARKSSTCPLTHILDTGRHCSNSTIKDMEIRAQDLCVFLSLHPTRQTTHITDMGLLQHQKHCSHHMSEYKIRCSYFKKKLVLLCTVKYNCRCFLILCIALLLFSRYVSPVYCLHLQECVSYSITI